MERKNTILLTVIAVATLLVAVVGATFAYFTATTQQTGTGVGEGATQTTQSIKGVNLKVDPIAAVRNLEYPGGFAYTGISAKVEKQDAADVNNYSVTFGIKIDLSNTTKTALTWKLYRSTSAITNQISCPAPTNPAQMAYSCTGENKYGTVVDQGTVAASTDGTTAATVSKTVANEQMASDENTQYYYYLVVDYPNSDADQNSDMGKVITAKISSIENLSSTLKAA